MLDFSWSELMVVVVVVVLAVGPKRLPEVLHGLGRIFRRLQYMRYSLTRQFDDFMDQADLKDLRDSTRMVTPDLFDEEKADTEYMTPLNPPAAPEKIEGDKNDG